MWLSDDEEFAAAIVGNRLLLGNTQSVANCVATHFAGRNLEDTMALDSNAAVASKGSTSDAEAKLVGVLSDRRDVNTSLIQSYTTETRFNKSGIESRTLSDFGLIGSIIAQLGKE